MKATTLAHKEMFVPEGQYGITGQPRFKRLQTLFDATRMYELTLPAVTMTNKKEKKGNHTRYVEWVCFGGK